MKLVELAPVAPAALPVDALKAHLRLGSGFAEADLQDEVLQSFLRAALAAVEARSGKALLSRTFRLQLTAWRDAGGQGLGIAPVSQVTALRLVAADGGETLVDAGDYRLEQDSQQPRLRPSGSCLPMVPDAGHVEVDFSAGYGADWAAVPADLAQAVLMLAAHYYEYRNDVGLDAGCMPFGVSSLLERYRPMRLGAST